MDPLSHVFQAMRVNTSECVRLEFRGSWGFRFDGYEHAHFGVISHGSCWLNLEENSEPKPLNAGDVWLLPRGHTHILRDDRMTEVRPYDEVRSKKTGGLLRHGSRSGRLTTIIVGNFTFDGQSGKWLTDLLPEIITFRMDEGNFSAMQAILQILAIESKTESMGFSIVVSRLADILFVQAIRAYAAESHSRDAGWLGAIGDRQLRLALDAMHEGVGKRWTVESLASIARMSRSGFAARFKEVLGESPLQYLTRWRMYKAAQFLRESNFKAAKIASLVGYESDGAFNKAFKKATGTAPGAYRRALHSRDVSNV